MSQLASYFTILASSAPKLWYISWLPILSLHWKLIVSYLLIIRVTVSIWVEYQVSTLNVVNIRLRFLFPIVLHCVFEPGGSICCCFFPFGNIFLLFAIKHWTINNYWMNTFFSLVWFKFWLVTFFPELYVIVKSYLSFVVLITLLTHFPCIVCLLININMGCDIWCAYLQQIWCYGWATSLLWTGHWRRLQGFCMDFFIIFLFILPKIYLCLYFLGAPFVIFTGQLLSKKRGNHLNCKLLSET